MADEKRKSGFDAERMRGQLNEMWKNAMDGLEDLREVVLKASQNAKVRLDATFLRRERDRLYQQLGEECYELVETGSLKVPGELRDTVDRIHAIVEQIADADREAEDVEEQGQAAAKANGAAHDEPAEAAPKKKATRKKSTGTKKKTTTRKKTTGDDDA